MNLNNIIKNKKKIAFINNSEKSNKKKYYEEIFMPKFFLNLLNLSKKAEKSGRNSLNLLNQELILNSKTYFENIPSINIRNIKIDNNNKLENPNINNYKRFKYMSSLNSPGRVIIKPSLPIINYKANTIYYSNNDKNNDNNINNNKNYKEEDYSNNKLVIRPFPIKNFSSLSINQNNSRNIFNINKNRNKLLNNMSFPKNIKINNLFNDSNNNSQLNTKIDDSWNINNKDIKIDNYINYNKFNNNKNKFSVNNYIDLYINKHYYSKKAIINQKKDIKENNKENFQHINNISLIKKFSIKTNNNLQDKNQKQKIILPLRRIDNFSINFRSNDEISYLFLNKKIINQAINLNIILKAPRQNFYYYINKMYRNQLTKYMKHRINWKYTDYNIINNIKNNKDQKLNININFEWKYFSNRLNYNNYKYESYLPLQKLRMINLFENNYEIGNKKNMFLNLINYCDKIKYNIFEIVPFTLIISYKKDLLIAMKSLKELIEFIENNKNNNSDIITDNKYNEYFWYDKNYEKISNQIIYINKNFISEKNYWIIKPTDLYQGKYIEICNSYEDIKNICINMFKGINDSLIKEDEEENSNSNNNKLKNTIKKILYHKTYYFNEIIIQKYLDNPLLYKKRKFDIRCFVLLDHSLNLFYCREGHLKGSSELYNVHNSNKFIHITNYSFQKKSSKFEKYEEGNEISYKDFKLFLEEENIPLEKFNLMIEQIKFIIKISFKSVNKKLYKINNVLCFELFGYDFIIDNDFKPWLLEINNNPGLGISSSVIKKIIPRMMDDIFRLTIDKVFETRYSEECIDSNGNYKSRFPIEGYSDDENIFEFLCNIK